MIDIYKSMDSDPSTWNSDQIQRHHLYAAYENIDEALDNLKHVKLSKASSWAILKLKACRVALELHTREVGLFWFW